MVEVEKIRFNTGSYSHLTPEQKRQKRENAAEVAAGVGTAGVTAQVGATNYANRKGLMGFMRKAYERFGKTTQATKNNKEVAAGLIGKFRTNVKRFTDFATKQLSKYESVKVIGSIIKSPAVKTLTGIFGASMAAFVLITGINDAVKNGKLMVGDLKDKLDAVS